MMRLLGLFGILTAAFVVVPGSAAAQADAPQIDVTAQKEKKICKTERVTGSLTRRTRICLTESEWARMAEHTRSNVKALENDANQQSAIRRSDVLP